MCLKRNDVHCVCRDGKCAQDGTYASTPPAGPTPTPLKLEVEKTYVTNSNEKVTILCKDGDVFVGRLGSTPGSGVYGRFHENGHRYGCSLTSRYSIQKEYKKPKIIQHDIILWYHGGDHTYLVDKCPVGWKMDLRLNGSREISRQTVTFKIEE